MKTWKMLECRLGVEIRWVLACLLLGEMVSPAVAQVVPDGTLGADSSIVVPVDSTTQRIDGGAIRGSSLFHSFLDFNVAEGTEVYFSDPAAVSTIFSRVTGNDPSNIFGTLGVLGNASLFLMNPNGIVFGPGAQLDIKGSFVGTTAEWIDFGKGLQFSAVDPAVPPLLNIVVQPGLQYGAASGSITNQGNLQIGRDLTLGAQRLEVAGQLEAGRDIVLQGQERRLAGADYTVGGYWLTQDLAGDVVDVVIPHERVIVSEGDVQLNENYVGPSLYVLAGGQVSQAEGVDRIEITGSAGGVVSETVGDGLGGFQGVTVRAGNEPVVDIRSGVGWVQAGSGVGERNTAGLGVSLAERSGGGIVLGDLRNEGGSMKLVSQGNIRVIRIYSSTFSFSDLGNITGGNGGDIFLSAGGSIRAPIVDSSTFSFSGSGNITGGNGGDIFLSAGGDINTEMVNSYAFSYANSGDVIGGNGGDIFLSAGGDINIDKKVERVNPDNNIFSYNSSLDYIDTIEDTFIENGDYTPDALDDIIIEGGTSTGFINSYSLSSSNQTRILGNGGDIILQASLGSIRPTDEVVVRLSAFSASQGSHSGEGGIVSLSAAHEIQNLEIQTVSSSNQSGRVEITGTGRLSISSLDAITTKIVDIHNENPFLRAPIFINTDIGEQGRSGDVEIIGMGDLTFINSSFRSGTNGTDNAGDYTITSPGRIVFRNTQISSNTQDQGKAGNTTINASEIFLDNHSSISSSTNGPGAAGAIILNAPQAITITGNGTLNAETTATGSAGNITATTNTFTLGQGTQLTTTATATARPPANTTEPSANITLNADEMNLFGRVEILSETQGSAPAGTLTLRPNTSDNLTINLKDQSLVSASTSGSGQGGSINLNAPNALTIQGEGTFSAETTGTGPGGNINLNAKTVTIDQAEFRTRSDGGGLAGNITANNLTTLLMQNGSLIRTNAAGKANGGNINIDSNFVIALPNENNDIIATAVEGKGGEITIDNADAILNIELNSDPNVDVLRNNTTNDISASSASGSSGILNLTGLNVDPAQSAAQLPTAPAPPSQVDRTCSGQTTSNISFTSTGHGGISNSPDDLFGPLLIQEDWVPVPEHTAQSASTVSSASSHSSKAQPATPKIQEATQWQSDRQGNITLLAAKPITPSKNLNCGTALKSP